MVGGLGTFTAWLVQASVDWMHLLPGLTAIALVAAVVLVWPQSRRGRRRRPAALPLRRALGGRPALALGASAVVATLIVAGASLSRQGLADLFRSRAQTELQTNRTAALADANRSLDIDADSVQTYYVKAAALARYDQARAAETALAMALRREPRNFVTWVLLGDIAARQGRLAVAKRYYTRASLLNPLNLDAERAGRRSDGGPAVVGRTAVNRISSFHERHTHVDGCGDRSARDELLGSHRGRRRGAGTRRSHRSRIAGRQGVCAPAQPRQTDRRGLAPSGRLRGAVRRGHQAAQSGGSGGSRPAEQHAGHRAVDRGADREGAPRSQIFADASPGGAASRGLAGLLRRRRIATCADRGRRGDPRPRRVRRNGAAAQPPSHPVRMRPRARCDS